MSETTITISFEEFSLPAYDCDCCGTCFPFRNQIQVNNDIVWFLESDGHMGADQTEESIESCIVGAIEDIILTLHFAQSRKSYLEQYPLSTVASTEESWNKFQKEEASYFSREFNEVRKVLEKGPCPQSIEAKIIFIQAWMKEYFPDIKIQYQ